MKSAGKARNNGLYRHIRTSKEIIRNLLNDLTNNKIWASRISFLNAHIFCICVSFPLHAFICQFSSNTALSLPLPNASPLR